METIENLENLTDLELNDISGGNAYEAGKSFGKACMAAAFVIALIW